MSDSVNATPPEVFLTMKEAAALLNIPYYKIHRAVKAAIIPHYCLFNSRKLVRVSDIEGAMRKAYESEMPSAAQSSQA